MKRDLFVKCIAWQSEQKRAQWVDEIWNFVQSCILFKRYKICWPDESIWAICHTEFVFEVADRPSLFIPLTDGFIDESEHFNISSRNYQHCN